MKKLFLSIPLLFVAGCTTEINVNGNNNRVTYDPAKYAGQGAVVDVLKGMSLPSLNLGGKDNATETNIADKKILSDDEREAKEPDAVNATVEKQNVTVTNDKVTIKQTE